MGETERQERGRGRGRRGETKRGRDERDKESSRGYCVMGRTVWVIE